jgi:hypothetical protein
MAKVDLAGIGIWSEAFSGWEQFCAVARGEAVEAETKLQPELISPRERRRAPQFVKMAVEVMDQACSMAEVERASVATVFASGMGDMQITDYMCRTLATMPRTLSPTKFHNSVHNAATGYWSIATASNAPANAVSGYEHSGGVALLEGAIQAVEENIPVLIAVQEAAAPKPFKSVYDSDHPLAIALLLTPRGTCSSPVCELGFCVSTGDQSEIQPASLTGVDLERNFAAKILGLLLAIADGGISRLSLPIAPSASLAIDVTPSRDGSRADG